jgi:chromosomal replication initiation ATPase DnaA
MKGGDAPRPRQLPLGLRHAPAMSRADFLTGEANREPVALIDRWPDWPWPAVVLTGPAGSGKSHLVEVWRATTGGAVATATTLTARSVEELVTSGAVAVEDVHAGPLDEAALFHLINLARERRVPMLITSRVPPASLPIALPDLASRLRASHLTKLGAPDEDLLRRVLVKLFADRQLTVEPAVLDYLLPRMERSLAAASAIVDILDQAALAEGRAISRPLVAAALGEGTAREGDPGEARDDPEKC